MRAKKWWEFQKNDLIRRIKTYSKIRFLLFFSLILGFLISLGSLWQKIFTTSILELDNQISIFLKSNHSPFFSSVFEMITFLGSEFFITSLSLVLLVFLIQKRRKRAATTALISLVGSALLVNFFKSFFGRQRPGECPDHLLGGAASCFSFPSGHSAISFYFYGLIVYLIFRFGSFSKNWRLGIGLAMGFLIILIAFSRLYLGLHFLSDVIGGFLLGGLWLTVAIFLIDFLY